MKEKDKKEETKPMRLPRFSYQIPEDLTSDFLQKMKREFRETPGDCLTAIVREYFQRQMEEEMSKNFIEQPEVQAGVPRFAVRPLKPNTGEQTSRASEEE